MHFLYKAYVTRTDEHVPFTGTLVLHSRGARRSQILMTKKYVDRIFLLLTDPLVCKNLSKTGSRNLGSGSWP